MSSLTAPLPSPRAAERPVVNPWIIAVTVTLATFMEPLDTTIANVSLPHIAGGLGVSYDESTWVLTSYLVSNAVVLPLSAWLSRVFGRKRYYMLCVVLFTLSSLLCRWRHPDPVVEIRLLADRNFAIANAYYFLFGFALFGSTVITFYRSGCFPRRISKLR